MRAEEGQGQQQRRAGVGVGGRDSVAGIQQRSCSEKEGKGRKEEEVNKVGVYGPDCGGSLLFWKPKHCLTHSRHSLDTCRCDKAMTDSIGQLLLQSQQLIPPCCSRHPRDAPTHALFSVSPGSNNSLPPLPMRPVSYQNNLGAPAYPPLDLEISKGPVPGPFMSA